MKDYSGYFPIELYKGKEFYDYDESKMFRLNCGRSAILAAIKDGKYKKIYIPLYTCKSVSEALERNGIAFEYYHINQEFFPIDVELKEGEILLWTNYFGIAGNIQIKKINTKYKDVLFDNTQAFYVSPVLQCYNAYSPRKFFGVSDGAYLLHEGLKPAKFQQDYSAETAGYMLESIENGTNYAYAKSLKNEERIEKSGVLQMSTLTQNILSGIDYDYVAEIRRNNYKYVHEKLKSINQLSVEINDSVPMIYPLWIENDGLRKYLIDHKIYVPQWWKWVVESGMANEFEESLSNYLFALPIDQRYTIEDMRYICELILDYCS